MASTTSLKHATALLHTILNNRQAADKQMEMYFRAHPKLGMRDRGFIAETVYGALRKRRSLEHVGGAAGSETLVATYLLLNQGWSARALEEAGLRCDARTVAQRVREHKLDDMPVAVRADLPDWLAHRLIEQLGEEETLALAEALNQAAPVDLRVNTLKTERDTLHARLFEEGYPNEPTPYSPTCLRRHDRAPLFKTKSFQEGWFEIQDEGSQLLSLMVEPKRRERVVDFCAGAGGKTLHLGALMANTGTIYAFDVSAKRLDKLKPRLARAGLDTVRMQAIESERDVRLGRLRGKIDRVLVDAPCSGTGTLRRNPDIKWREQDLDALVAAQQRILASAARLVRPGGRLVYATCSLLKEENEDVVTAFLVQNPDFHLVPANTILARRHIEIPGINDVLRLFPHRHRTDGFFAVALERQATTP